MHFANDNWFFFLLPAFGILVVLAVYTIWRDRRDLKLLGIHNLVLAPGLIWTRRFVKGFLVLTALTCALLGALRFQGKPSPEDLDRNGIDVMIVLDVSKSMLTTDISPNRLEASKKSLLSWMEGREGDRMGMVVFSGEALVQVPLTLDLQAVSMVLDKADVEAVGKGGTDIGEGIRSALTAFPKEEEGKRGRAIILMTDGESTEGASNVTKACLEAKGKKVPILAVGVGTRRGRPIPDGVSPWGQATYKKDMGGNVVVSRLDEETLAKIADITGGAAVNGDRPEALAAVGKALEGLQKTAMKDKGVMRRKEYSPRLGAFAAGALILGMLL